MRIINKKFYIKLCGVFSVKCQMSNAKGQKGIATLPTLLALGILILAIGVGITAMSFTEMFISASQEQSLKALYYAEAGARDALERIARNKNFATSTPYQIQFISGGCADDSGCANVSISSGTGAENNPKIINSSGRVYNNIRRIEVGVIFDSSLNGEIATTTWREVTE